jgi:ATP/ADP translocase/HEAT repeat protein
MNRLLEALFNIRPREQKKVLLMLLYSTCLVASGFVLGRTVASTLFLKRIDPTYLPFTYVAIAIFVSLVLLFYARVASRLRRDRTILITLVLLILGTLAFRGLVELFDDSIAVMGSLFVFVEILGTIAMVQFWTFANDIFNARDAKRLFSVIGAGGSLAAIMFGALVRGTVNTLGAPNLLFVMVGLLAICLVLVLALGRMFRADLSRQHQQDSTSGDEVEPESKLGALSLLGSSAYLRTFVAMTVALTLVVVLIDYQFLMTARGAYQGDEVALATFFGTFYMYTGMVSFVFQFFFAGRLVERFGLLFGLLALPVVLMPGSFAILLVPAAGVSVALWTATSAKGSDNVLRYGINNPTSQLLYQPLPSKLRAQAKALMSGFVTPVANGLAGLLLLLLVLFLTVRELSYVVIPLILVRIYFILRARKHYMISLTNAIQKGKLDLQESTLPMDETTEKALGQALVDVHETKAFNALTLLGALPDKDWDPMVLQLLMSRRAGLRLRALKYLGRKDNHAFAQQVQWLFNDPDPEVRAQAIAAYCEIDGAKAIGRVEQFLTDPDPNIKTATITALIKHGGLDGILMAADEFKAMLSHQHWQMRAAGVRVLEAIEVKHFYQPLVPLLDDEDLRVQVEAIRAASAIRSPDLLPLLIEKLGSLKTLRSAVSACASFGDEAVDALGSMLQDPATVRVLRLTAPRVLGRVFTQKSADVLMAQLQEPDEDIRHAVIRAIERVQNGLRGVDLDHQALDRACHEEIRSYFQHVVIRCELKGRIEPLLLGEALSHLTRRITQRIMRLLNVMFPTKPIGTVARALRSPDASKRAKALELLDNLLGGATKQKLLCLLEETELERKVKTAGEFYRDLDHKKPEAWLAFLMSYPNEWIVTCAVYQAGASRMTALAENVRATLTDPGVMVRESAIRSLGTLMEPEAYREILNQHQDDQQTVIAQIARTQFKVISKEEP